MVYSGNTDKKEKWSLIVNLIVTSKEVPLKKKNIKNTGQQRLIVIKLRGGIAGKHGEVQDLFGLI